MSANALYLDSSALVKLVIEEPESVALQEFLGDRPIRISCVLAQVEVVRAVRPHGEKAVDGARSLLADVDLIHLDEEVLQRAAIIGSEELRTLDAIHLAAASLLAGDDLHLVTYDRRMSAAARELGLSVFAPA
ncbi:MAG: type II toxin-antitoxin system VapC family toxin [Actinomycetota bacterium]